MAREMLRKLRPGSKAKKPPVPTIEITLTTFNDDGYGSITEAVTVPAKIDGEDEASLKRNINDCCSPFKSSLVRNLLVLSTGQFLLFVAFDNLANLQTTLNGQDGVGTTSMAVLYGVLAMSSFLLPTLVIRYLGCKRTLVFSMLGFCPFVLGNFYPSHATLVPTAIVCGLVSGPLWSARSTYVNRVSRRYAKVRRTSPEVMNVWFFSVCTALRQSTEVWGGLLSHHVLGTEVDKDSLLQARTIDETQQHQQQTCGPEFCGVDAGVVHHVTALERRYALVTIHAALVLAAAFITAVFLEPLEPEEGEDAGGQEPDAKSFLASCHQMARLDQVLLVPLSLYTGVVDGFYTGDYTKAYVACSWGVPFVGTVSMVYGLVSVLVDLAGPPCVLVLGRAGLFFLAAAAHLAMLMSLTLWRPYPGHTAGFFLVAAAHGIGNGVWMSQLTALYGTLFRKSEEAAFSCFYFLNSLGFLVAYTYSSYVCTNAKLFVPLSILVVGLVCYLAVEIRLVKRSLTEYELKRDQ